MFLVKEAFRYGNENAERRAATNAEQVVASRAIEVGRRLLRQAVSQANLLLAQQQAMLQDAHRARVLAAQERRRVRTPRVRLMHVIVIPPLKIDEAREKIKRCESKIESDTAKGDT